MSKREHKIFLEDGELRHEFVQNLKNRSIDQKFIYIDEEAAELYYTIANNNDQQLKGNFTDDEYVSFISKYIPENATTSLISLGCGNAQKEEPLLRQLSKKKVNIDYIGVDTSDSMLQLAKKYLKEVKLTKSFICEDILNDSFRRSVTDLTGESDARIFAFLGNTLGNVNQTNIADVLYNLLSPNDLLWIDVLTRPDTDMQTDLKIFNRYSAHIENDQIMELFFNPLKLIGVPSDSGQINLCTSKESSVGAILFTYYYFVQDKVIVNIDNERIHLLPGEEIVLQNIRVYHPETLINFFSEHEFKLEAKMVHPHRAQFLFRK